MIKPICFISMLISISTTLFAQANEAEFRAAWVASVTNIDWPASAHLSTQQQQESFIRILDHHERIGLNAVIVQIRPSADALYPSPFEPWSQWLTGTQGKMPEPYYDPLQFMIAETHKRNMQFHAWLNPYRAVFNTGKPDVAPNHISRLHPEWFLTYGDKKYFNPGLPEARNYVTEIVKDIVTRYEVDAIHFDDYFYPYKIPGKEFPDAATYKNSGTWLSKDDWRRSNTDSIIKQLYFAIKKIDSNCQFGISPFGVWRNIANDPDGSKTTAGVTNYDDLYADILLWMKNKWVDYVTPQLYWEFEHKAAPYQELVEWWGRHTYGVNCYIGLGIYRAGSSAAWRDRTQLPRQIQALRNIPNLKGMAFYSSKILLQNPQGWSDSLQYNYFKEKVAAPR